MADQPNHRDNLGDFAKKLLQDNYVARTQQPLSPKGTPVIDRKAWSSPSHTANPNSRPLGRRANQRAQTPPRSTEEDNPFQVTLLNLGGPSTPEYYVTVESGYVNERITRQEGPDPNTKVHIPHNLLWGVDAPLGASPSDPRLFPIGINQQVSVVVYVSNEGGIGGDDAPEAGPVEIVIETEDYIGTHYVPPVGDDEEGAPGDYHYKLAVFRNPDDDHPAPWLQNYLGGSHISHFRDLPSIKGGDIGVKLFEEYDIEEGVYKAKNLIAGSGITLTDALGGITIDGFDGLPEGVDFYLQVYQRGAEIITITADVSGVPTAYPSMMKSVTISDPLSHVIKFVGGIAVELTFGDPPGGYDVLLPKIAVSHLVLS